jgi:hypothetical protein
MHEADLIVEEKVMVELKSVEKVHPAMKAGISRIVCGKL